MRKTKLVILLLVWFIWATGKDLDALVRFSISTDYYIFAGVGLTPLFFVMALIVFLLNTAAVFLLFRPTPIGLPVLFNALAAAATQNVVTISFALSNLPAVREAYVRGRELRGLPVREEALSMIFTEQSMLVATGSMLCLYGLIAFVVYRSRDYFHAAEKAEA